MSALPEVLYGRNSGHRTDDGLGSVRLIVDATGAVEGAFDHDVWGVPDSSVTPPGAELRAHSFQGGLGVRNDTATLGLHYARQRYYSSDIGRWLSQDPIGFKGGLNLYTGMKNNPTNFVDSSGLDPTLSAQLVKAIPGIESAYADAVYTLECAISSGKYKAPYDAMLKDLLATLKGNFTVGLENVPVKDFLNTYQQGKDWADTYGPEAKKVFGVDMNIMSVAATLPQADLSLLWIHEAGHLLALTGKYPPGYAFTGDKHHPDAIFACVDTSFEMKDRGKSYYIARAKKLGIYK